MINIKFIKLFSEIISGTRFFQEHIKHFSGSTILEQRSIQIITCNILQGLLKTLHVAKYKLSSGINIFGTD